MNRFVMLSIEQKNKKEMYIAVQNVVAENMLVIITVQACLKAYNKFIANIASISETASERDQGRNGATDVKHSAKEAVLNIIYILRGKIFNFAVDFHHPDLEAIARISRTALGRLSYNLLYDKGKEFHTIATRFMLEMDEYGVNQEYLDNFLAQIDDYKATVGKAKGGQTQAKTDTSQLKSFFSANDVILHQLDNFMDDFEKDHPVMVMNYRNARVIYDLGGSHKTDEAAVTRKKKTKKVPKKSEEKEEMTETAEVKPVVTPAQVKDNTSDLKKAESPGNGTTAGNAVKIPETEETGPANI